MLRAFVVLGTFGFALTALPGSAAAQDKLRSCYVGQKVLTPGGYPATVSAIYGTGGCTVKDAKGLESSWAAFMLSAAPGSAPAPAARNAGPASTARNTAPGAQGPNPGAGGATPANGSYQCFGGTAGNMKLTFGPGRTYANEQGSRGTYSMRPSGQMQFDSGPWKGFYAKTLDYGRVGLTSRPDGTFYQMTCDKR